MIKLNKKRNNPNSVGAYECGCPFGCSSCGCSCPPTGISSGTVENSLSGSPSWQNAPKGVEQYR